MLTNREKNTLQRVIFVLRQLADPRGFRMTRIITDAKMSVSGGYTNGTPNN